MTRTAHGATQRGDRSKEIAALRARVADAEQLLKAINEGQVDAVVRSGPSGEQVYTLRGAERPYRMMVETMSEGAVSLARDGVVLYCNRRFAELIGRELERVIGARMQDFIAAPEASRFERLLRQASNSPARDRISLVRPDGSPVPTQIALRKLNADAAETIVAVATDLTDVRQLQAARDQLASIVDGARVGIIGKDLSGIVTSWNHGAEEIYGYSAAEMIGLNVDVLAPAERKHEVAELIAKICRGEEIGYHETERVTKSGRRVSVSLSLSPIRDLAGKLVGISTVTQDISDQVQARDKLREAAHYTRNLFETSLDPLVTISADGKFTDVNEATVQATGVPRDTLIGSDFASYFTDPDKAYQGYREAFARGSVQNYALSLRHSSGTVMEVLCNARVYRDASGTVAGLFAAARDITQLRRDEQELRRHREHLEELVAERTAELAAANVKYETANKELEAFAYSVSHDLRAPLRAVDGFSRILLEDYGDKLDAEAQRVINVIRDSTVKMDRMISDILSFSRVGRGEMTTAVVDMEASVRSVIHDLETAIAGRKITFGIGPLPPARGDAAMLQRVWLNLLDNAVKFTGPKPEARIEVGANAGARETVYFVRDNGIGFDMKYVDKIFGLFQRLHGPEFGGTGIGLAIVDRIVARHGGRVWAEGKPEEGATFYFALPEAGTGHG